MYFHLISLTAVYLLFTFEWTNFDNEKALESSGNSAAAVQVFRGNKRLFRLYASVTKYPSYRAAQDGDRGS